MKILPVYCNNKYIKNRLTTNNPENNNTSLTFQGQRKPFDAVNIKSLKTDAAKKIYERLQLYYNLLSNGGNIENVKIMSFNMPLYESDLLLSMRKTKEYTKLKLFEKTGKYYTTNVMDALFDKDGLMINGHLSGDNYTFERFKNNKRIINWRYKTYRPIGNEDTQWEHAGLAIDFPQHMEENPQDAAFELFFELARLRTSIKESLK